MIHILELSAEILVNVFSFLSLTDIYRCKQTCRTLSNIIAGSVQLDYQIELQKAGMLDNPYCTLPLSEKLHKLKDREFAWATLKPKFVTKVDIPHRTSDLFDVSSGIIFLGKEMVDKEFVTNGLQALRLPSQREEDVSTKWKIFDLGMSILEFKPAVQEHDMIAFVVMVPNEKKPTESDIKVILRRYSDPEQAPPAALQSDIFLCEAGKSEPTDVYIEIAGENLAVLILFEDMYVSHLQIFNWKTGQEKNYPENVPISVYNGGIIFLREDLLLHSGSGTHGLAVFHIPPSFAEGRQRIRHCATLHLPLLQTSFEYTRITMRSNPACMSYSDSPKYAEPRRPFINDPSSTIIVLTVHITCIEDRTVTPRVLVIKRATLLGLLDPTVSGIEHLGEILDLSWEIWGPSNSRWLEVDFEDAQHTMNWAGQRYVQLRADNSGNYSIRLFDFNPFNVQLLGSHNSPIFERPVFPLRIMDAESSIQGVVDEDSYLYTHVFKNSVRGRLPCAELTFGAGPVLDTECFFMDEESLIRIRTEEETRGLIKSMQVIYIG